MYNSSSIQQTVNWTGTKIDLIELIYALHHSKKLNNGNTDIKELAVFFGKILNQDIEENIYRFYIDIKNRKTGRSKFINQLSEVLEKQILEEENESK